MRFLRSLSTLMVLALLIVAVPVAVQGDNADETTISITDSRGIITNLTGPATRVASFGAFATNTLVDIGMLESVAIFDATSEFNKSAIPEMQGMPADRFVTVSSANKDMVVQTMLGLVDDGKWNKSSDVVLGYGYSYLSAIWADLEDYGFNVVTFYPNSYDGIVQVVEDIETLTGANHSVSAHMTFVKQYIAEKLVDEGVVDEEDKVSAVYVSFSGDVMYLANNGSVTVDFITFAGGVNVAQDDSISANRYSADYSTILQLDPEFILLDGYYSGTAEDFKARLFNDDIAVYKLNKSWNSYCPDATEGLWTVACLFYPDYFEGELPVDAGDVNDGEDDNTMIYAVVGIVVVAVAIAAVFLMRKKD